MPTVEALERLSAILGRLAPLAKAQPGQPIEAARWNTLVEGVLELTRAVLDEGDRPASVPPHDHPEQVRLNWLHPDLRAAFERGGLSDPATASRPLELDIQIRRATDRLDRLEEQSATLRERVVSFATNDALRGDEVIRLRRAAEAGGAGTADQITALRRSLDIVSADARRAIVAASALSVNGQPLDAGALLGRVGELERLRDGLRQSNQEILTAAGLERRLAEIEARSVSSEELDEALKSRPGGLSTEDRDALRDNLRAELTDGIRGDLDALETRLRANTAEQVGGFDALVTRRLAEATPALRDEILAGSREAQNAANAALRQELLAATDSRLAASDARLVAKLTEQAGALEARLPAMAGAAVETGLSTRLAAFQAALDTLGNRLSISEAGLAEQGRLLGQANERLAVSERNSAAQLGQLRDQMLREMSDLRGSIGRDMTQLRTDTTRLITETETRSMTTLRTEMARSEERLNASIGTRLAASGPGTGVAGGGIGGTGVFRPDRIR
ncbi:hypothetical protein J8J14_13735 [Roseomonas sp. SSH11]|uniref:Chromosome partition protein Smc n=1 Tax=Pararoseomonas baculiformis TaxID=2820812 RepID=A0ABS4AFN2_9PROT|nr:hypothetical protein [Pararoseomonas baculiformis]MBP0445836.1 hypothetical protein [Pararoseomonas baculiformis]